MIRRALIISGAFTMLPDYETLEGTLVDVEKYVDYLQTNLGGNWYPGEIHFLHSPTLDELKQEVNGFLRGANYTFIVFSGHGGTNVIDNNMIYLTLFDKEVPLTELRTTAERQTVIIDACRDYTSIEPYMESANRILEERTFSTGRSTRALFEAKVLACSTGIIALFASKENESSGCDEMGSYYLNSLLSVASYWEQENTSNTSLSLKESHNLASDLMKSAYFVDQHPEIKEGKRLQCYPFAVKFASI